MKIHDGERTSTEANICCFHRDENVVAETLIECLVMFVVLVDHTDGDGIIIVNKPDIMVHAIA